MDGFIIILYLANSKNFINNTFLLQNMPKQLIIGLTGPNAAGKGTAAEYLKQLGFSYLSLSDILREELKDRKVEESRVALVDVGNELRKKHGAGVLGQKIADKIKQSKGNFVVDSIRNPAEIAELRKLPGFVLFGIDAPIEVRYDRIKSRGRLENANSLKEFEAQENKENSSDPTAQQLHECMKDVDLLIMNDTSIADLHKKLGFVLANLDRLVGAV
jgi:dephospho-CoA kinase